MQPVVKPLSLWQRKLVFGSLLLAFLIALPISIFYATGYRYDFSAQNPTFTATGGFYIVAEAPDSDIYIDDTLVTNIRTFRSASYIQGLEPGLHRIHVQTPGAHTWVKELPVAAHIVTEAEVFNLPLEPQVRLIPEYYTNTGAEVIFAQSSSSPVMVYLSTTTPRLIATSTATSTYRLNQEYTLLEELFAEQASSTAWRKRLEAQRAAQFSFATSAARTLPLEAEAATTTIIRDTLTLFERAGDIYVSASSQVFRQIPHYFCATGFDESDILGVTTVTHATTTVPESAGVIPSCRSEIRIDRLGQTVKSFDFFPSNSNLVLLHLDQGVYVVEIDDRSWQNAQPLYRGADIELLLYRGGIFIKEGDLIFEVIPEIVAS